MITPIFFSILNTDFAREITNALKQFAGIVSRDRVFPRTAQP